MELNRRKFVTGGAAALALGAVAGTGMALADEAKGEDAPADDITADTEDTVDVVVVGAGASGVAAAVQAAQLGAKVVLLEKQDIVGGNGVGTEGLFAVGSKMQEEAGISIAFKDVVSKEQEFFNYRVNALLWKDMTRASGDNIEWLKENGVEFGEVNDYNGLCEISCFHWFKDGAGNNYIAPMVAKAEELGATVLTGTPAVKLEQDESGAVVGCYAQAADGTVTLYHCSAVILATGGYVDDIEAMKARGYTMEHFTVEGLPGHDGDGLRLAKSVGGVDITDECCIMQNPNITGVPFFSTMSSAITGGGPVLWVNENGERYVNESCGAVTPGNNSNAIFNQKQSWIVMDQAILDSKAQTTDNLQADVDAAVEECPADNIYKADTLEELASFAGIDADTFCSEVERYNELCAAGEDDDFNKPAENMIAIETAPFYIFRNDFDFWTSVGAIDTSRQMEVLDADRKPIVGLYAVGTDGCKMYRETYTINIGGSCNANNVNSGRVAAREACKLAGIA